MTNAGDLANLHKVTDALYQRELQSFQSIVVEENQLRSQLSQLDAQLRQSCQLTPASAEMRTVGADVIWQAWVGKKKAELNMRLAQVLALKEQRMAQVREAYGKVLVTGELQNRALDTSRHEKARTNLARAIDVSLLREFSKR